MLVKVYKDLKTVQEFQLEVENIKDVLCGLKMLAGEELTDSLLLIPHKYVLTTQEDKYISLIEETALTDLSKFKVLSIFPNVSGEDFGISEAAVIAAAAESAAAVAAGDSVIAAVIIENAATVAMAVNAVIAVGISMAINGIMQLLSPTTSFSSDPAQSQQKQSSLFNGAPLIKEQGSPVPLWYGESYCGGVLVSSSISTSEG